MTPIALFVSAVVVLPTAAQAAETGSIDPLLEETQGELATEVFESVSGRQGYREGAQTIVDGAVVGAVIASSPVLTTTAMVTAPYEATARLSEKQLNHVKKVLEDKGAVFEEDTPYTTWWGEQIHPSDPRYIPRAERRWGGWFPTTK